MMQMFTAYWDKFRGYQMPNWCANHIEISGPTDKIKDLYEKTQITNRHTTEQGSETGFLEYLAPQGEWDYHQCIEKWGTKWEVDVELQLNYTDSGAVVTGYFESAWSPPVPAINHFLAENTDCDAELHYYEPSMDYCGTLDTSITISDVSKQFFQTDPVGKNLDRHFDIVGMLEEYEEQDQAEALATPPDVITGEEPDIKEETL